MADQTHWTRTGGTTSIRGEHQDEVEGDETYEYLLTVSAENAESASANVAVMVLERVTS